MPGRHQAAKPIRRRRPRLRWLTAVGSGAAIAAAVMGLSGATAGATSDPVKATFGATGVATSNCSVSIGGTDIYVKPHQELDVKTSLVGLYVLEGLLGNTKVDLNDVVGKIASFDGSLVIDPGSANPTKLAIENTTQKVTGLSAGNHSWKWTVDTVKLLNLVPLPVHIDNSLLKAGAKLTWTGTIHVTSDAAHCGVAVQLPSISASASVSGLPPVAVGIPGVKASVPVDIPSLPGVPGDGGGGNNNGGGGSHHGGGSPSIPGLGNPIPVPAQVVPGGNGGALPGGGGGGGFNLGNLGSGSSQHGVGQAAPAGDAKQGATQNSTGPHKSIDLAAGEPASSGEVWVVLAIIA
ncbi:MAG TPA: hypothetical protein VE442_14550, partial [Jatrophihabitans sp.]|nr:hypothetical protein [Jatrophihabitans sp.]